ncbi:MAG: SprT family zinc-dependent metalloprotease, partial [Pseudomonadota bacterium]
KQSVKSKNISIRISSGNVFLVIPNGISHKLAYDFIISKELWIRNKLLKYRLKKEEQINHNIIPIFGDEYDIIQNDKNIRDSIIIENNKIIISSSMKDLNINSLLISKLKKIFKQELEKAVSLYAKEINVSYKSISIKDTKTRWGSCSTSGNLSFSWRLIFAPKSVFEYVVIHELCHIKEMNHSRRFWRIVESICPNYKQSVMWLKQNGQVLHKILEVSM